MKNNTQHINSNIPKKISNNVSYLIHSHHFSPYYIFECLLQYPIQKNIFNLKQINIDVLSTILNMLNKKDKKEKLILKKEIYLECSRNNISLKELYTTAWYLKFKKFFLSLYNSPSFILSRIGFGNFIVLRSKNRNSYSTILKASEAIKFLKDKRKEY